ADALLPAAPDPAIDEDKIGFYSERHSQLPLSAPDGPAPISSRRKVKGCSWLGQFAFGTNPCRNDIPISIE
ncbi:hypothetical protein, partial [Sinorhizobium meliloti]|uniref:hypothetical protein n=1 Tax=Rhizobium meliloti TaxID=382 RepID=UPI001AECDAAC